MKSNALGLGFNDMFENNLDEVSCRKLKVQIVPF
jgi:hypothetical protein